MEIQAEQQLRIDELTELIKSQPQQVAPSQKIQLTNRNPEATTPSPCALESMNREDSDRTTLPQHNRKSGIERPSYRDATAGASRQTKPPPKPRNVPWAHVTEDTNLGDLSESQQAAIKRVQKVFGPLSRKPNATARAGREPVAVYFGNVKRAPYRTIYKSLNRVMNRYDLLGVSLIGRDIIELLITKSAVPATLMKLRFTQWTHLKHFNPETEDTASPSDTNGLMTQRRRIHAIYMRWYNSWLNSRSPSARQWYATQGNRLAKTYEEVFSGQPERLSFEQFRSVQTAQMNEATMDLRAESRRQPSSSLEWIEVHGNRNSQKETTEIAPQAPSADIDPGPPSSSLERQRLDMTDENPPRAPQTSPGRDLAPHVSAENDVMDVIPVGQSTPAKPSMKANKGGELGA